MSNPIDQEEFTELENELRQLRPIAASGRLLRSLAEELDQAAPRGSALGVVFPGESAGVWDAVWRWLLPIGVGMAFAWIGVRLPHSASKPGSDGSAAISGPASHSLFKPVYAEQVRFGDREVTYVTLPDGTPARQLRDRYVETIVWQNPQTKASLKWSIPRDEIRVIPIRAQ